MVYYIKVTPEIAKKFASVKLRNQTKDNNILLWIGDLNAVPGDTIAERAKYVGGALLTPDEARCEYFGEEGYTPAQCYTPDYYKEDKSQASNEESSESETNGIEAESKEESEVGNE